MKVLGSSLYENFKMAIDTLKSHKLRSFLTILGVVVGVITVMLISSIISGIDTAFKKEIESFGTRSIFLYKFDIGVRTSAPTREERTRKPLTMEDADALRSLPTVEAAVPFLDVSNNFFGQKILVTGKNGKTSSAIQMNGTLPDLEKSNTEILVEGRWFTQSESDFKKEYPLSQAWLDKSLASAVAGGRSQEVQGARSVFGNSEGASLVRVGSAVFGAR